MTASTFSVLLCVAGLCTCSLASAALEQASLGVSQQGLSPEPRLDPNQPLVEYTEFTSWIQANGVKVPKARIHNFGDGIRGVVATKPIERGETIVSVPFEMLITVALVQASPLGPALEEHSDAVSRASMNGNAATIALYLMYQRSLGNASHWFQYLELLPKNFTTPLFWEDSELEWLQSREMVTTVKSQRRSAEKDYELLRPILLGSPELFPGEHGSMQMFRWASQIVITRYCELGTTPRTVALAPMYDLPNHNPRTRTTFHFDQLTQQLRVVSGHSYKPGEQIFMSYGPKHNQDLIYVYGISFLDNPYGALRVGLPVVPAAYKPVLEAVLRYNQVSPTMTKLLRAHDTYTVPDQTLATLRVLLLRSSSLEKMGILNWNATEGTATEQLVRQTELYKPSTRYALVPQQPLSVGNELNVLGFLLQSLTNRLNRYNSTLGHDWSLVNDKELWQSKSFRERLALYFRIDEKQNVLHFYSLINDRRLQFMHDQLGGWELPASLSAGSVASPRALPSKALGGRWKSASVWKQ